MRSACSVKDTLSRNTNIFFFFTMYLREGRVFEYFAKKKKKYSNTNRYTIEKYSK